MRPDDTDPSVGQAAEGGPAGVSAGLIDILCVQPLSAGGVRSDIRRHRLSGRCSGCGFHETAGKDLCPECLLSSEMDDDRGFVITAPRLSRAFVSHWARAIAVSAFSVGLSIDHGRAIDLMREGSCPAVGNPALGARDPIQAELLRKASVASFRKVVLLSRPVVAAFGTDRPSRVSNALSLVPEDVVARIRPHLHVFPRRIATRRIRNWLEEGMFS